MRTTLSQAAKKEKYRLFSRSHLTTLIPTHFIRRESVRWRGFHSDGLRHNHSHNCPALPATPGYPGPRDSLTCSTMPTYISQLRLLVESIHPYINQVMLPYSLPDISAVERADVLFLNPVNQDNHVAPSIHYYSLSAYFDILHILRASSRMFNTI